MESCLIGTWDWSRILFLLTSLTVCQRVLLNLCFIHFPWVFTIILCLPCLIVLWLFCLVFSLSATVMMEKLLHVCLQSSILYLIHFRVLYLDTSCLLWWFCLISLLSVCHCQPIVSFVLCWRCSVVQGDLRLRPDYLTLKFFVVPDKLSWFSIILKFPNRWPVHYTLYSSVCVTWVHYYMMYIIIPLYYVGYSSICLI